MLFRTRLQIVAIGVDQFPVDLEFFTVFLCLGVVFACKSYFFAVPL